MSFGLSSRLKLGIAPRGLLGGVVVPPFLGTIALSDSAYQTGVAESGVIYGVTPSSIISTSSLPFGFTINGPARTWAWDGDGVASVGSVTFTETLAGATNTPRLTAIALTVTISVTLNVLTFSDASYVAGTAESGTIFGATANSTITFSALPAGLTINAAARTFAWDGTGSASTPSITLTETLAGATNTPRLSSVALTITPAPSVTLNALTLSDVNYVANVAESGTINGAMTGSTITPSNIPTGFTINSAARTWAWDGTGVSGAPLITLSEALAGATNTPRSSGIALTVGNSTSLPEMGSLVARWRASDIPVQADNTDLASWTDSINGLVMTPVDAAKKAKYRTNVAGTKPAIRFAGIESLTAGRVGTLLRTAIDSGDYTVMCVVKNITAQEYGVPFCASANFAGLFLQADGTRLGQFTDECVAPWSNNLNYVTFGIASTPATTHVPQSSQTFVRGGIVRSIPQPAKPTTENFTIGIATGQTLGLRGDVIEILIWNKGLKADALIQADNYASSYYEQVNPRTGLVGFDIYVGDSITAGIGAAAGAEHCYPYKAAATRGRTYGQWTNMGYGSIAWTGISELGPVVDNLAVVTAAPTNLFLWEFYNTRGVVNVASTQVVPYLNARLASTSKIIFGTTADYSAFGAEKAAYTGYWDTPANRTGLIDAYASIHTNVNIGVNGAQANATYFADFAHLTSAGYTVLAGIFTDAAVGIDGANDNLIANPIAPSVTVDNPPATLIQDTGALEHSVEFTTTLNDVSFQVFPIWNSLSSCSRFERGGANGRLAHNIYNPNEQTITEAVLTEILTPQLVKIARQSGFYKVSVGGVDSVAHTLAMNGPSFAGMPASNFMRIIWTGGTQPTSYTFRSGAAQFGISANNYSVVNDTATFSVLYGGTPSGFEYSKNGGPYIRATKVSNTIAGTANYVTGLLGLNGSASITVRQIDVPANVGTFAVTKPIAALFGLNLTGETFYQTDRQLANLAQASYWVDTGGGGDQTPGASIIVNANGDLVTMGTGGAQMRRPFVRPGGVSPVRLRLKAKGTFTWSFYTELPTVISNVVDSVDGLFKVREFDLASTILEGGKNMWLCIDTMSVADPIREIDCREVSRSIAQYDTPEYLARTIFPNGGYRFMDEMNTNGPGIFNPPTWTTRALPNKLYRDLPRDGIPVETIISRSNALGKGSIWVTPHMYASTDYLQNFWGALHAGINPGVEILTQPGNEIDNFMFPLKDKANNEGVASGRMTAAEVTADAYMSMQKEHAFQMNRHSEILLAMNFPAGRFVRVLTAMGEGYGPSTLMINQFNCTAFDAVANAPYFGHHLMGDTGQTFTFDMVETFARLTTSMNTVMDQMAATSASVKSIGRRSVVYEGGIHWLLHDGYTVAQFNHYKAVQRHPSMKPLIKAYLNRWKDQCGDLFCYFNAMGGISSFGAWGVREHMDQALIDTPKLAAIQEVIAGV